MDRQIIELHPLAPPKPPTGAACNGCGACCTVEPCPVGALLSLRRHGRCDLLRWSEAERRYRCGLVAAGPPTWRQRVAARWIAAGSGCDAYFEAEAAEAAGSARAGS